MRALEMEYTDKINSKIIDETLEGNLFLLHYQPQSSLKTNKVVSMEALIRWPNGSLGNTNVVGLIYVLEHSEIDLIIKFHQWLIREALSQIVAWRAIDVMIPVFLNFSARFLQLPECLSIIKNLLREYDLPASCLGIEVTESCSITDMPGIKFVLLELHKMGLEIVLDDFCTSYCSLEYLTELPATKIKIDKQFIQNLGRESFQYQNSLSIVLESIVDMAQKLKIEVIAEGVETIEQLEQVTYLGCDAYQGYLYCPPVPACYVSSMILNIQNQKEVDFCQSAELPNPVIPS